MISIYSNPSEENKGYFFKDDISNQSIDSSCRFL